MDNLTANAPGREWADPLIALRAGDEPERVLRALRQRESDENSLRLQLAVCLNSLIRERGLTQMGASAIFGIPQPHISELRNHKLSRFSSERLLRFITLLDRDVAIVIRPKLGNGLNGAVTVQLEP